MQKELGRSDGMQSTIHVAMAIHDRDGRYSQHAGVVACSIFANTRRRVQIHILHDSTMTTGNMDNFLDLASRFGQTVKLHDVTTHSLVPSLSVGRSERYTLGAMYRFLLPSLLDTDKVIYLDSDIVVTRDIGELWDIPLEGKSAAAVQDIGFHYASPERREREKAARRHGVNPDTYFNSGVMLWDLSCLREGRFDSRLALLLKDMEKDPAKYAFPDQDVLNILFTNDVLMIDSSFNYMLYGLWSVGEISERDFLDMDFLKGKILHYATCAPERSITPECLPYWMYLSCTKWSDSGFSWLRHVSLIPDWLDVDDFKSPLGKAFKSYCKIKRQGFKRYLGNRMAILRKHMPFSLGRRAFS